MFHFISGISKWGDVEVLGNGYENPVLIKNKQNFIIVGKREMNVV
ncbi:hypothetical protein [Bacillus cereus]|nr:hypothetical protein [Bacillus cereus]